MTAWARLRIQADRIVALIVLVAVSPLIGVLALLIRRGDGGPPFITVPRVGRDGQVFGMWKLRSMRVEGRDGRAGGVALTAVDDDRITPIGHRLRGHHLDELPQLWNVVTGQMCLLGARPEAPDFVAVGDPIWRAVLAMPPGIAGPTQLIVGDWERAWITASPDGSAYRDEVLPVKLAIDEWYVRACSPRADALVARSLLAHLRGRPVEALRSTVAEAVPAVASLDSRRPHDDA